jgi:hypothetical protein
MNNALSNLLSRAGYVVGLVSLLSLALLAGCAQQPQEAETTGKGAPEPTARTKVRTAGGSPGSTREATADRMEGTDEAPASTGDGEERVSRPSAADQNTAYGYTYGRPTGNRSVGGAARLPGSDPVDVRLSGVPDWVVGAPVGDDTVWTVALRDGRIEAFRLDGGTRRVESWSVSPDRLPPEYPPAVAVEGENLRLLVSTGRDASDSTHPTPISASKDKGSLVVAQDGRLFTQREGQVAPVGNPQVRALPDARPVRSPDGRIAVLSDPTRRYVHGVIGDDLEAEVITVLEPSKDGVGVASRVAPESGGVFELVSPLWFEGPGGEQLLAVTESVEGIGSRISAYRPDGNLVAAGPFYGEPQRWHHLLAAGPFGPNGELELAVVRTPHIGGVVEFYAVDGSSAELEITATQPGYATHRIYTRNLDTARAGDLDGDGRWELLIPDQTYTELGAVRHEPGGARVAWTLPAGGTMTTNLASAEESGGRALVAVGRADGMLRIWR